MLPKRRSRGFLILLSLCLCAFTPPVINCCAANPLLFDGTIIKRAVLLPDGTNVTLSHVRIDKIVGRTTPSYLVAHDDGHPQYRMVIMVRPPEALRVGQVIDASGTLTTAKNGERRLVDTTVYAYFDRHGGMTLWAPLSPFSESQKQALPFPTGPVAPSDPSLSVAPPADVLQASAVTPARYSTVSSLHAAAPPVGAVVEIGSLRVAAIGDGFVVVGDDRGDAIMKVYTKSHVGPTDRILRLTGTVHTEGGRLVLYAGAGPEPYFDPQGFRGELSAAKIGTTAYAATLPDSPSANVGRAGAMSMASIPDTADGSWVYLTGRTVTNAGSHWSSQDNAFANHFYIQGPDRTGMRVLALGSAPAVGSVVDVMAKLSTLDGERTLGVPGDSTSVEIDEHNIIALQVPEPVAISSRALCGLSKGANPALLQDDGYGPYNIGTFVRFFGRVRESGDYAFVQNGPTTPYTLIEERKTYNLSFGAGRSLLFGAPTGTFTPADGVQHANRGVMLFGTAIPTDHYAAIDGISSVWRPDGQNRRAIWQPNSVIDITAGSSSSLQPVWDTGTISGTVYLYDMANPTETVYVHCQGIGMKRYTVVRGQNGTGSATYTFSDIPRYRGVQDPFFTLCKYIISARCNGYKTRSHTDVWPGDPWAPVRDIYLVPLRKLTVSTQEATCPLDGHTITAHVRNGDGGDVSGHTVRFRTTSGSFDEGILQQTTTAVTDDDGLANVHLYGQQWWGTATVDVTDDQTTPGRGDPAFEADEYKLDWITLEDMELQKPAPSVWLEVSANPTEITGTGTSTITFTARDEEYNTVEGIQLSLRTTAGGLDKTSDTTDPDGQVNVTLTLSGPPAAYVSAIYTDVCFGTANAGIPITYRQTPWSTVGVNFSSPLVADLITNDNGKEVAVISSDDGYLYVWNSSGTVKWGPSTAPASPQVDEYANGDNTLSAADLDTHDGLELVAPDGVQNIVHAFGYSGGAFAPMAGFPVNTDRYSFARVSAALADANLDGAKEVVAGDESCWVFSWNGTGDWNKNPTGSSYLWMNLAGAVIQGSSVAVGDVDSDAQGMCDAVVGAEAEDGYCLYALPGDEWGPESDPPTYTPGWDPPMRAGSYINSSPAIGDIDGDGKNDVAVGSSSGIGIHRSGDSAWTVYKRELQVISSPALGDLDGDGKKDIVFGCDDGRVYAVKYDGAPVSGWEGGILLHRYGGDYGYSVKSSPAIADVIAGTQDNTGKPEVILGCNDGFLYVIYATGRLHVNSSGVTNGPVGAIWCCRPAADNTSQVLSSPTVDDIDNNGKADIIVGSQGDMWRFEVQVDFNRTDTSRYPWPTFHHDAARTGCATAPASPVYSSIVGQVTNLTGDLAIEYKVYIYFESDTPTTSTVPVPKHPGQYRTSYVKSVGNTDRVEEANRGGYSINQLQPSASFQTPKQYKIKVVYGTTTRWAHNITLSPGVNVIPLNMVQMTLN